jgi:ankyrin repeat protein
MSEIRMSAGRVWSFGEASRQAVFGSSRKDRIGRLLQTWVAVLLAIAASGCSPDEPSEQTQEKVENPATANSLQLNMAAGGALSGNRPVDAGFFFFAAQVRFQIDREVFPPAETGGNSPGILKAALSATMGPAILLALVGEPDGYPTVAERLARRSPSIAQDYDPGWKYDDRLDEATASAIVKEKLDAALESLRAKARLYGDAEYRRLAKRLQESTRRIQEIARPEVAAAGEEQTERKHELMAQRLAETAKQNELAGQLKAIEWRLVPEWRWHAVVGWKAQDYFDDPQVQELCAAIEDNDIEEMNRLISAGADVNAIGRDGMTPLLWSFPDRKLERFECLLRHGADPNVVIEGDFGIEPHRAFHPHPVGGHASDDRGCPPGFSVTLLAARSPVLEYLKLVLEHGGDARFADRAKEQTPLEFAVSLYATDSLERVAFLASHGADLNRYCKYRGDVPAGLAVKNGHYAAAQMLLELGADPKMFAPTRVYNVVMTAVLKERGFDEKGIRKPPELVSLMKWLEENVGDLASARKQQKKIQLRLEDAVRISPRRRAEVSRQIIAEQEKRNERQPAELPEE